MINLERFTTIITVVAVHGGLLVWMTTSVGQTPPKVVPPAIEGVLVPAEAPAPRQPLPAVPKPPEPPPLQSPRPSRCHS